MTEFITRDQLKSEMDAGTVTVVETLPEEYYVDKHLPGAILIPDGQAEGLAPSMLPDLNAPIVTYCSNEACSNSQNVAEVLGKLGYTNVRAYREGKQDWVESGLPVETGK